MCGLKASVSMNMLHVVIVAPALKPWMFWLKPQNMQDVIVMAPGWETDAREAW